MIAIGLVSNIDLLIELAVCPGGQRAVDKLGKKLTDLELQPHITISILLILP